MADAAEEELEGISIATEALVVRIQTLFRARLARRQGVELANSAYLKCWDAVSGFAYYCNLRTGTSTWKKPLLLAARDAPEAQCDIIADLSSLTDDTANTPNLGVVAISSPSPPPTDSLAVLNSREWQERFDESVAFQKKCADEKHALMHQHRKKIARAMRRFERDQLDEKRRSRAERLERLKGENKRRLQGLYDGKEKENVETIREAAMRGHLGRIEELLSMGFSPDSQSAMGLTPLLAACQSGRLEVVQLLLANGASVNHTHIKTGRTALMEAASRAKPPVIKELLRYGARIHVEDTQGETVFDSIKDAANREIVERACRIWSVDNAALFPVEFRRASLVLALVSKRQRDTFIAQKAATRRELILKKQTLQRQCVDAKVRYDQDVRSCKLEPTLMRRLQTLDAADSRYDSERRWLLLELQNAVDRLRNNDRPRFMPESAILTILSFCDRHWFEVDRQQQWNNKKNMRSKHRPRTELKDAGNAAIVPSLLRVAPDQLPKDLEQEWDVFQSQLKRHCDELQAAESSEHFDTANGVSKDSNGRSLATLDVLVEQAENLPWRDPRIEDPIDPYVRVFLRETSILDHNATPAMNSDMRLGDRNPVWDFACRIEAVPSVQRELGVQVVDKKRQDVAGEVVIPLRSLLDQKNHVAWYEMPATLRQQILEQRPRAQPARLRVTVRLTHTKVCSSSSDSVPRALASRAPWCLNSELSNTAAHSFLSDWLPQSIVLARELQQLMKTRETLVKKKREFIQDALDARLLQLP